MTCELCGSPGPHEPLSKTHRIVRCGACALVFYDGPLPELQSIYQPGYFHGEEYWDYESERSSLERNFRERIRALRRRVPQGALLELGCAYGFFLKMASAHWTVRGYDIFPEGPAYARARLGVDARCEDFLRVPDEPASRDIVCLWDTIEHLREPVRAIEKTARWLKPGGVLALTTGDIASFVARWRGERWRQIHPPTHLFYFSPATIDRAFAQAGLRTVSITHPGQWRSWHAAVNQVARDRTLLKALAGVATFGGSLDFPFYLNSGDLLLATGEKL